MSAAADHTVLPRSDDAQLSGLVEALLEGAPVTVGSHAFALSEELREVLLHAAAALRDGQAVTVQPKRVVLSTQEAADVLAISRPTLVKLLEDGRIPFTKPGRHRRVRLADVLAYQDRVRSQRRKTLDEMAAEAAADGSYGSTSGFVETR